MAKRRPAPSVHRVDAYAEAVTAGRIVAGPLVRLACARHQRDRKAARWHWDSDAADRAMAFFETVLRLPDVTDEDGQPRPFLLQPWQAFIIGSLFGWKQYDGGPRRYQDAYIEIGKGSGKSPMAAGIGLYGLVMDGELSAEIYSAATSQDQARVVWRDADGMVQLSPDLRDVVEASVSNLAYAPTRSFFRPVSSEHRGLDGKRPHMGILDELHEHPNAQVTTKIRAGRKGRRQPLFVEITNSGYDLTSICWQHHEKSRKVLEGVIEDDQWFAYVCGLDDGDDPLKDQACWPKANPNLGVSIQPSYLESQVRAARDVPSETNLVLRLNFCVWTRAQARFIPSEQWAACRGPLRDEALIGLPCYAGLDLGETDDFSAFALVWLLEDGRWYVRGRCWIPDAATVAKPDRPYRAWVDEGTLTITDGNQADYDLIETDVLEACQAWGVRQLAYDKRFAEHMAQHLTAAGVTCVDTPQGYQLNAALRELSRRVKSQALAHDNATLMAWHIDNAVTRAGREKQIRLDKDAPGDKMDWVAALAMASSRALLSQAESAWTGDVITV